MVRGTLVASLLVCCVPTPGETDAGTSTGPAATSETGAPTPTSETGDVPGLIGSFHNANDQAGDNNLGSGPPLSFIFDNLEIRADGTLAREAYSCDSLNVHEYAWELDGDGPAIRVLPLGDEPLKWGVDTVDAVTIRPGDSPGEVITTAEREELDPYESHYLPRKLCPVGAGCFCELFYCDEVPPPMIDPLCPPAEPAHLEFVLSSFGEYEDVDIEWECTITDLTPLADGGAISLACLDEGTPIDPPPVLTITGQPAPDLSLFAIDKAITLTYFSYGWGGLQLLRVSEGDTVLAATVHGWEFVEQTPFTLGGGEQACAPECEGCWEIVYYSVVVTIDGASVDLPSQTFGEVGPYDAWAGRTGAATMDPWCSDTGYGTLSVSVLRRP